MEWLGDNKKIDPTRRAVSGGLECQCQVESQLVTECHKSLELSFCRTKMRNLVLSKSSLPLSSKGKVLYSIRAPKKGSRALFHSCLLQDTT